MRCHLLRVISVLLLSMLGGVPALEAICAVECASSDVAASALATSAHTLHSSGHQSAAPATEPHTGHAPAAPPASAAQVLVPSGPSVVLTAAEPAHCTAEELPPAITSTRAQVSAPVPQMDAPVHLVAVGLSPRSSHVSGPAQPGLKPPGAAGRAPLVLRI